MRPGMSHNVRNSSVLRPVLQGRTHLPVMLDLGNIYNNSNSKRTAALGGQFRRQDTSATLRQTVLHKEHGRRTRKAMKWRSIIARRNWGMRVQLAKIGKPATCTVYVLRCRCLGLTNAVSVDQNPTDGVPRERLHV